MEDKVSIESITHEALGVGRLNNGKTIFIYGAIPEEDVLIEVVKHKNNYSMGKLISIISPSRNRVEPKCKYFGVCGGCSWQHIDSTAQILYKQQILLDSLFHIGGSIPKNILKPLQAKHWGYRHRARLSVRYVAKKSSVLIGFREKGGRFVMDMDHCHILSEDVSNLIPHLRDMFLHLSIRDKIPQIEVAMGDFINVIVIRNIEMLSGVDEVIIREFVDLHNQYLKIPLQIWLQPQGVDSCHPFYPIDLEQHLSYLINKFNLTMPYYPSEFTQVNPYINQLMINRAIELLELTPEDIVFDFFCGIGNFTLPIATIVKLVVGVEGSEVLVQRAKENAKINNLSNKVEYHIANLFAIDSNWLNSLDIKADKWLIDPPRDGAINLIQSITPSLLPQVIVYVSCNMATLARDTDILVNKLGYTLEDAGVMDMFAHTSHVESIARFIKKD